MPKVLHLLYSSNGGTASVVFSLIEADKKKKLDQSIIFIGPKLNKHFCTTCHKLNIKYTWVRTIKFFYLFSFISTLYQIKKNQPEVIFIHNYYIIPCVIYKLFKQTVKIFYINHKAINLWNWKESLVKLFYIFLDRYVFLNKYSYDFAKKNFSLPVKKICLITNGINTDFFRSVPVKNFVFKIGMACRVNKLKHYDLIANCLNTNILNKFNIKFSLAGSGEDLDAFKKRVKNLGIKKKVETIGYLNETKLKKWYKSLDLYVQASVGEAMSTSLLQAMSMEVPVIGSRVAGITDVLGKKNIGLLFENNMKDLSNKIKFFYLANKKTKLKFTKAQRNYVLLNHSYIIMFSKYYYEIKKLLQL